MALIDTDKLPDLRELTKQYLKNNWEDEYKRPTSILTDKQRRFIHGLVEYTGDNTRQRRYQIRKRIRRRFIDGLQDLSLLNRLDENSKQEIVDEMGTMGIYLVTSDFLEFVYSQTEQRELLKKIVSTAVYNAESANPGLGEAGAKPREVTVNIDVEYSPDYMELERRYRKRGLSSLRPEEIGHLVADHRLDPEDLQRFYDNADDNSGDTDLFDGVERPDHPKSLQPGVTEEEDNN